MFFLSRKRVMVEESQYFSTNHMPYLTCPQCGSKRSWSIRRYARKCKHCRKEWVPSRNIIPGIRADEKEWRDFAVAFLRYRTVVFIRTHTRQSKPTILKMSECVRKMMAEDVPDCLSGTIEIDETYIGPQWRNRRWVERKLGTKKGRGTQKQAVFGIYERQRGMVLTFLVPDAKQKTVLPIIQTHVLLGSLICTDGFELYRMLPRAGYRHASVDHKAHEYVRGDIHSNAIEGFWGILKRRLKTTGGIRRDRLGIYVAEETWRYNFRKLSEKEKTERILGLLKKVGG